MIVVLEAGRHLLCVYLLLIRAEEQAVEQFTAFVEQGKNMGQHFYVFVPSGNFLFLYLNTLTPVIFFRDIGSFSSYWHLWYYGELINISR